MKNIIFLLEQQVVEKNQKNIFNIIIEKLKEINEYYELVNLLWIGLGVIIIVIVLSFNKRRVNKKSKVEYKKMKIMENL